MEEEMESTWKPREEHGELTERSDLPDSVFAFPRERKEPLTDAHHVRNAIARFDQVIDVSNEEREQAFENLKAAARYYGVEMSESQWQELGSRPKTGRTAADRERAAREAAETRKLRGE
jgi:SpoVK/Ycf46/Vps4 family AAA+-type ATPase